MGFWSRSAGILGTCAQITCLVLASLVALGGCEHVETPRLVEFDVNLGSGVGVVQLEVKTTT